MRLAVAGDDTLPDHVLFLACSGALSDDLDEPRPNRTVREPQLEQYATAMETLDEGDVEFVLLSVGGNDTGFGDIGKACAAPGDCSDIGERWLDELATVGTELTTAYTALATEVGDIPVYVLPYPVPLTEHGCWWSWLNEDDTRSSPPSSTTSTTPSAWPPRTLASPTCARWSGPSRWPICASAIGAARRSWA